MHDGALETASTADSQGKRVDDNAGELLMQIKIWKFFYILAGPPAYCATGYAH
jgi:hypothetical protein